MGKMMTTALAGAFLGLTAGGVSAADPFSNFNLNGSYVIQAHGFEAVQVTATSTGIGENAILGLVTFDGNGGVLPGGGFSFSQNVFVYPTGPLGAQNCSLTITGGSYAIDTVSGAGTVTMTLGADGAFPGGAPACHSVSTGASLTFSFVLNNSGVLGSLGTPNPTFASSAALQLINFNPNPLTTNDGRSGFDIAAMTMTGSLRLQGSASE
jgi:hypothetical protein